MVNNHKAPLEGPLGKITDDDLYGKWKIQLKMQINFISSLDPEEIRTMDSKSKNIEILMCSKTDDIINELFESFSERYQEKLEEKMKDSKFVFKSVDLLYYSLHITRLRRGKSYIESPEWLRNKRATINPKNKKDDKCFQYALTVALRDQNIERDPQRIPKIKPFVSQYNWKDIDFTAHQKDQEDRAMSIDWKKFE